MSSSADCGREFVSLGSEIENMINCEHVIVEGVHGFTILSS